MDTSVKNSQTDLARELDFQLSELQAGERLAFLEKEFPGQSLLSSSFGLQAVVLLDLIKRYAPSIPIIFVDTGYHFAETYRYVEQVKEQLLLDIKIYAPALSSAFQEAIYGRLWEQGEEGMQQYAVLNKIEPMDRALREHGATIWISGIRRSQAKSREDRAYAEAQSGTLKVYPILDWSDQQVEDYIRERGLPEHPLKAKGYVTMGDWHSTRIPRPGESAEETRFNGAKYECGLHLDSGINDFQI